MSQRYKGGVISATPPTTSTSSASGVWTEQQFMQGVASGSWPALAGAPTIGTATAGALSASVTFTAPTYTGSGITGYTVTSSPGGITGTGASSPVTVSGLTAGTPYTFTVTATTAAGQGPASAASNSVTPTAPNYIEDVFSTYLYTGTGASQTITNNINASTKGALFWLKSRNSAEDNRLVDTVRGPNLSLASNTTLAQDNDSNRSITATSSGFTTGPTASSPNTSGTNYVAWTFAKQAKFFDVVTYTGTGSTSLTVNHNLGSTPGCIIIKWTSGSGYGWYVYHRATSGTPQASCLVLNSTGAAFDLNGGSSWIVPSSTNFQVATTDGGANASGESYVAYLFAHNAGGFGLTGTDDVISCGSVTNPAGSQFHNVSLGWEPQWLLVKNATGTSTTYWQIVDNMRGLTNNSPNAVCNTLRANATTIESNPGNLQINATGFSYYGGSYNNGDTLIYIAIRRGPMKVPTSGTSVYQAVTRTGNSPTVNSITSVGFPPDSIWQKRVSGSTASANVFDRLIGRFFLAPATTSAETAANTSATRDLISFDMTGFTVGEQWSSELNANTRPEVYWNFRRAPSFFDEVCYTGTGTSGATQNHNLGVVPELVILKCRSAVQEWRVMCAYYNGGSSPWSYRTALNTTGGISAGSGVFNDTAPTASVFTLGNNAEVNDSGSTYVAYLFATCAGVSKVGSYTGTGALLTVNCGFAAGARFVLIKRTDSTGDWYTYDSARGISSSSDPYLLLNSTAVEVTGTNYVDTTSVGFQVTAAAPAGLNASGGTYIFLAIA